MTIQISEVLNFQPLSSPSVSPAGQGKIYYESSTNKFRFSQNAGAYVDFGTGTGSGSGADTSLSNLSNVTVNTALLPAVSDADGYNIGSLTKRWSDGYFGGINLLRSTGSSSTPLILQNSSTSVSSAVTIDYKLVATSGDGYVAARIAAGKEQIWTSTSTTQDGYLGFFTVQDSALNEWGRFTSAGTLQLNKPSGNAISIVSGSTISLGSGGTIGISASAINLALPGNGLLINGGVASWTLTGGISALASSAVAWLRQNQNGLDARVMSVAARNVGDVAVRVGTGSTDAQGAKNAILFQAVVDAANSSSPPIARYAIDGYGNTFQDGYANYKVLASPNDTKIPPVGLYSPAVNTLSFATNSTHRGRFTADGYFGINTTAPVSFLDGYGSFGLAVTVINTDTTLTYNHHTVLADGYSAGFTVTLPVVSTVPRRRYEIKKIDSSSNTIVIDGDASDTIDDALTYPLTVQYQSVTLVSSGSAWYIV